MTTIKLHNQENWWQVRMRICVGWTWNRQKKCYENGVSMIRISISYLGGRLSMLLDQCPHSKLELVMDLLENLLVVTGEIPGSNLTNNNLFIALQSIKNDTRKNAKVNLICKTSSWLQIEFWPLMTHLLKMIMMILIKWKRILMPCSR